MRVSGRGTWSFPLSSFARVSMPDHKNILALPAALSGFRLTPPADPMRAYARSLGSTGPAYLPSPMRWHIQYSRLLKSVELPNRGSQEVNALKRKNPGGAFRHQPGFLGNPREAPDIQVTSRFYSGGYRIPIPVKLTAGRYSCLACEESIIIDPRLIWSWPQSTVRL